MMPLRRVSLWSAIPCGLYAIISWTTGILPHSSLALLLAAVGLSIGIGSVPRLSGLQYTFWIITAVVAGMGFPELCLGGDLFNSRNPWLILFVVQGVMFGMGTQMRIADFMGVFRNPKGVFIGLLCQFSIMPLVGYLLAMAFQFPPEIGAGIVLIGSCSSGLASNVMTYLARANLALSVTVTACATLLAPLMTPLLMKLFAGTMIEINFWAMMMQITKIVLVPIGAALLHDLLRNSSLNTRLIWVIVGILSALLLVFMATGGWNLTSRLLSDSAFISAIVLLNFVAGAIVFGWGYHLLVTKFSLLQKVMPYFSMFGIFYFTTVTTAAGRDNLLAVGMLLLIAAVLHNAAGYSLGYLFSRLLGLDVQSSRAMALEVGLQNGGMASGLAGSMNMLGTLGLAAAVFSPWMNVSGSLLANFWKNRKPRQIH